MEKRNNTILSSRVRLARNLKNYRFPDKIIDLNEAKEIIDNVSNALNKVGVKNRINLAVLKPYELGELKEEHLISDDLIKRQNKAAVVFNEDKSVAVMINEEDHIRIQTFGKGLALDTCYREADIIDNFLSKSLDIAYSESYGFQTSCITNIGTGLRASVMLFLPAITLSNNMDNVINFAGKNRLTVRGLYGEGSSGIGFMYQVSNQISIGMTEKEIIDNVKNVVEKVCQYEAGVREEYKKDINVKDKILRSFGILTYSEKLDEKEFNELFSLTRFGMQLDYLKVKDLEEFDRLRSDMSSNAIMSRAGKMLNEEEEAIYRAEQVKKVFKEIITVN